MNADELKQLAEMIPHRIPYVGRAVSQVLYMGAKRQVRHDEPDTHAWLYMALMEEVESRDWYCEQRRSPLTTPTYYARVNASERWEESPVLALMRAVSRALYLEGK